MTSNKLRVALAQINVQWQNKKATQKDVERFVSKAAHEKADLVVFPETTLCAFPMNAVGVRIMSEPEKTGETVKFFQSLAKKNGLAIIFGVSFFSQNKKCRNMAVMVDGSGRITAQYQNIHPFTFGKEDLHFESGEKIITFTIHGIRCSVLICYDLRFPGVFEAIARQKSEAVFVIANWPKARIHHWKTLLPARALDLQSYIIGVNRVGTTPENIFNGQSAAYAPDASALVIMNEKPDLAIVTLDKKIVTAARRTFPSLKDKRFSVYSKL